MRPKKAPRRPNASSQAAGRRVRRAPTSAGDARIEKIAASHYRDLPYHNFQHIRYALVSARDLSAACRRRRLPLDERVVYYALLFHDAGYHEDHQAKGFAYKEDYSARLAEEALAAEGVEPEIIGRVAETIRGTRKGADTAPSNELKVVRAADLAGLAADYPVFRANTVKLWREHERMTGERVSWPAWRDQVLKDLEEFLALEFFAPPGPQSVVSHFTDRVRRNLDRLRKDEGK